jgi:hypothetical protein
MGNGKAISLSDVKVGDLIFGLSEDGSPKLLYVYRTYPDRVLTRLVTSQTKYSFGRNGLSLQTWDGKSCRIVPVAPLTVEERPVALGVDEKMRSAKELVDLRLSPAEVHLLSKVARRIQEYVREQQGR